MSGSLLSVNALSTLPAATTGERQVADLFADLGTVARVVGKAIRTPPGEGSPAGRHSHEFDQVFVVLSGTMLIEIDDEVTAAGPGSVVMFPAGRRHRHWNEGPADTEHVVVNIHQRDPAQPGSAN